MDRNRSETKGQEEKSKLPPVGKSVLVQGDDFRCMAYRDNDGKWRDYFHREELRGPIKIVG